MKNKPSNIADCNNCPLKKRPFCPHYIPANTTGLIIGEAPGATEAVLKKPFVGKSGKLLERVLNDQGIDYETVARANACACRPFNNATPTDEAIQCCKPYLNSKLEQIGKHTPLVVVGASAAKAIIGNVGKSITSIRGENHILPTGHTAKITFHPAYILRKGSLLKTFAQDLYAAFNKDVIAETQIGLPKIVKSSTVAGAVNLINRVPEGISLAYDIETTQVTYYDRPNKPADKIVMIVFTWSTEFCIVIPSEHLHHPRVIDALDKLMQREDLELVAHNGKFDVCFLKHQLGINARVDFDTMLAHYALEEVKGGHGLKKLVQLYFNAEDYEKKIIGPHLKKNKSDYSQIPFNAFAEYAAWDGVYTLALKSELEKELKEQGLYELPFKKVLMPLQAALTKVELHGMYVDRQYLKGLDKEFLQEIEQSKAALQEAAGKEFNPNSTQQLAVILYDEFKLKVVRNYKIKARSTSALAIEQILKQRNLHKDHLEFLNKLLHYRRVKKLHSSYVKKLLGLLSVGNRVHTTFNVHGTETGRLSATNPPLQTMPRTSDKYGRMIKAAFSTPIGRMLVSCDFSQAELRVFGALSKEPFLYDVYRNDRDLHSEVAKALFGENYTKEQRTICKSFNFAYIYGGTESSLIGVKGLPRGGAKEFMLRYDSNMPVAAEWKKEMFAFALKHGYVSTPFGRKRRFPLIGDNLDEIRKASINMPVQSIASDLTSIAAIRCVNSGLDVVLLVHDDIKVECWEKDAEEVANIIKGHMLDVAKETFPDMPFKVDVDITKRWSSLEK